LRSVNYSEILGVSNFEKTETYWFIEEKYEVWTPFHIYDKVSKERIRLWGKYSGMNKFKIVSLLLSNFVTLCK